MREKTLKRIEDKLEVLFVMRQTTIDHELARELSYQYNCLNLVYAQQRGHEYLPKWELQE